MKTLYFIIGLAFMVSSCETSTLVKEVTEKTCVVTEVTFFGPGQKHTLQTDPEWKVTLDCGKKYTSRNPIQIGDSVKIRIVKYRKE